MSYMVIKFPFGWFNQLRDVYFNDKKWMNIMGIYLEWVRAQFWTSVFGYSTHIIVLYYLEGVNNGFLS